MNHMYSVAVSRDFIASHYLVGGDWGSENELHSHHYRVEAILEGGQLDRHGYLVDITDVEEALEAMADYFRDEVLNDLPEFKGLNPSIEHLARIFYRGSKKRIKPDGQSGSQSSGRSSKLTGIEVRIRESETAWASYREDP
jgi:6-pyruvoyltetrahydropterin/6-carboxytetrahydropterin synthase